MCGKKRHTKADIRSEMSELICGRIAAGENYNLTRDNVIDLEARISNVSLQYEKQGFIYGFKYAVALLVGGEE